VVIGRPRKITAEALEGLLDWLLDNGDDKKLAYLDEMVHFLDMEYGIEVSKQTVSRALSVNDITRKAVSIRPFLINLKLTL
jgi:transposase